MFFQKKFVYGICSSKFFIIFLLLFLTTVPRVFHLFAKSLWLDEVYTLLRCGSSYQDIFYEIAWNDAHPPLFYLICKIWSEWITFLVPVSTSDAMKLVPVFFDVLTIICIYKLMRLFMGSKEACVSSLLPAFSCFMIEHSQDIRFYSLAGFLAMTSTYIVILWILYPEKKKMYYNILYTLAMTAGMHTFYYLAFLFWMHGIVLSYMACRKKAHRILFVRWLLSCVVGSLLLIPWFSWAIPIKMKLLMDTGYPGSMEFDVAGFLGTLLWGDTAWEVLFHPVVVFLVFLFVFLCWGISYYRNVRYGVDSHVPSFSDIPAMTNVSATLFLFFVGSILIWLAFPFKGHLFQAKHLGFLSPILWSMLSLSIMTWRGKLLRIGGKSLCIILLGLNVFSLQAYYSQEKQSWNAATEYVYEGLKTGDVVCFNPFYIQQPFLHYYGTFFSCKAKKRFLPGYVFHGAERREWEANPEEKYFYFQAADLQRTQNRDFWLLEVTNCPVAPSHPMVKGWCFQYYQLQNRKTFPGIWGNIVVFHFVRRK